MGTTVISGLIKRCRLRGPYKRGTTVKSGLIKRCRLRGPYKRGTTVKSGLIRGVGFVGFTRGELLLNLV
jgi:uncharacterized Fe-S cluster-containing radical SAM superfamily enzyme